MRIISVLSLALLVSSCSPEQVQSLLGSELEASQFTVKCENRTADHYYAKPDYAKRGFPTTAPYTEKYCSLYYMKSAWDGPYESINWQLPLDFTTASSANPDGSPVNPTPYLSIYNLNATTIRQGAVQMGILGNWGTGDNITSFNQNVRIVSGGRTYDVKYLLSPIPDDYVSVATAPREADPVACDASIQTVCLSDGNGNYWNSYAPRPPKGSCNEIVPKNSVAADFCQNLPASKSCPAPKVYCAKLDVSKRGWQTKVQSADCTEVAEYPELETGC